MTRESPTSREARRLQDIKALIGICMAVLLEKAGGDYKQVALTTELHLSTVYRMAGGDYTLGIHVRTLVSLAEAAGFRIELEKTDIHLKLK